MRLLSLVPLFLFALSASAQFIPPIPKTIGGGRGLNRHSDIPLPSPRQQWVRARSTHFVTLSGAGLGRTRQVVGELETVVAALREVDRRFAAEGDPTRLILFARSRDAAPYFDLLLGNRTAGAFVVSPDGNGTMLIDGSRPFADRTVFHELVHNLLANSGTHLPLWLEEGLAEYFSTAEVNGSVVRVGLPINDHAALLRSRPLIPVSDLFAVQPASEISTSGFFYAEAWAIVDWMMRSDHAAFYAFLNDVEHGASSAEVFRKHFHVDVSVMQHSIQSTPLRPPAVMTLRLEARPDVPEAEPLERDEAIIELATLLGSFEATRSDAERFLASIGQQNARAVAALASLRVRDKRYEDAFRLFEKALQLEPANAEIRLAFAESLLGNALGPFTGTMPVEASDGPQFLHARQLAAESLAAGGETSRANAVIGTSYLVETDVKPGIDALQRALAARPNRYDVALNLYALLLRSGDQDAAERLYKEISAHARTPQAIFAARAVVVREQFALVNRLLAQSRVDDAMGILQHLIEATPDPGAKTDLERQLAQLREVSDTNRQIATYNEAIQAANAGQTRKAIEILDRLLEKATDASVIRDAMDFRKVLEKRLKGMRRSRRSL